MSEHEPTKLEQFTQVVLGAEKLMQNAEANAEDVQATVRKINEMLDIAYQFLGLAKNEIAFAGRNRLWSDSTSHDKMIHFNDMVARYKVVCQQVEALKVSNKTNHSL